MNSWIEPPPTKPRRGCLRGCLFIVIFLLIVVAAILFISYRSITSAKIPTITADPVAQQEARARWDAFEQASRGEAPPEVEPTPEVTPADAPVAQSTPTPAPQGSRIEFTANDINQLIAANRKARGHAFVSIENNVGHVQVSVPLKKLKFGDRYLVVSGDVLASPDRDPRKLQVRNLQLGGIEFPERVLNGLVGGRSLGSFIEEYTQEYQITAFGIEDNKVILESSAPRP